MTLQLGNVIIVIITFESLDSNLYSTSEPFTLNGFTTLAGYTITTIEDSSDNLQVTLDTSDSNFIINANVLNTIHDHANIINEATIISQTQLQFSF